MLIKTQRQMKNLLTCSLMLVLTWTIYSCSTDTQIVEPSAEKSSELLPSDIDVSAENFQHKTYTIIIPKGVQFDSEEFMALLSHEERSAYVENVNLEYGTTDIALPKLGCAGCSSWFNSGYQCERARSRWCSWGNYAWLNYEYKCVCTAYPECM